MSVFISFFLFIFIIFYNRIGLQSLGGRTYSFTTGTVRSSAPHALVVSQHHFPTASPLLHFTLYSLLFLKHAREAFTSGPLILLFLLSGMLFSQIAHSYVLVLFLIIYFVPLAFLGQCC